MSNVDPAATTDSRRHFLLALRRILRPIIRLLIRNGIGYAEFADVARGAYVESAIRNSVKDGTKPSRAQVALVTGIPRQRVDHYIDDEGALPTTKSTLTNVLVEILHKWHTDPRYLDPAKVPLELEIETPSNPSFRDLVAEIDTEVSPAVILDELLRAKSVTYSGDRRIRALTRCFIWPQGDVASIEHFGTALTQLVETYEYNFNSAHVDNKLLERSVFADQGLPRKLLPEFQAHAKARTDQFVLDLDDWLATCVDGDTTHSDVYATAGVTVFLYVDPPAETKTLSELVQNHGNVLPNGDRSDS